MAGLIWLAFLGAAGSARASDNVTYQGGPVAHSMTGVIVDWGSGVNSMYTNETSGDPGLIKYLASESGSTGDIGGVTAQYMDSSGHNAANDWTFGNQDEITPSVTSTTIYDSQIQTELVNQIDAGNLPHPAGNGLSTIYLVLFPSSDVECIDSTACSANAPDQSDAEFCAYHSSTQLSDGTTVLYAVLPDNTTGPMSYECGDGATELDDQTSYLSHEWSETITDPLGDAWWVNDTSSADDGNEIADNCNQIQTSEGGWTVQELWSNLDGNCTGSEPAYSAPTASFVAPSVAGPSEQVPFDASSSSDPAADSTAISGTSYSISSGIASYQWNWGDGSTSTSSTPTTTHDYAAVGNYQVSLTVTDNLGFTSTVTHSLSITANGTVNPSASTDAAANVSQSGATLQGSINPENQSVQYQFVYGTSPSSLSNSTPLTAGPSGESFTAVNATVSGLSPSTTYYYQLDVIAGGQTYSGSVQAFTTTAIPPPPQTPAAATGAASLLGANGAVLTGTVDPGGSNAVSYWFAYGTSPSSLASTTPLDGLHGGTSSVPVSAPLSGLRSHTTYYFRLVVSLAGQTYSGSVENFTTHAPAPGVSTGAATAVNSSGAKVSGAVIPNGAPTTYLVEFGTTTEYGHSTAPLSAGAGTTPVSVTVTLAGLRPRTLYHYRLVATSAEGTTVGGDRTFTTAPPLKQAPGFGFALPARMALHGKVRLRFRCSKACTARFTVTLAASLRVARLTPVTVTLGRGAGSIHKRGWGIVTLRFSAGIRRRLEQGSLKLWVVGYAVSPGSARTAPRTKLLILV